MTLNATAFSRNRTFLYSRKHCLSLGGAEIISIDAYNKSDTGDGFVIGITILKVSTDTSIERYLNIYTEGAVDGEGDEASSIEAIAQNCLMVELAYTPYHLYHTILPQQNSHEVISCLQRERVSKNVALSTVL